MANDFALQLSQVPQPFLAGFGRYCVENGLSDAAVYARLRKAASTYPAVRDEIATFQKSGWVGPALNMASKAVGPAMNMGSKALGVGSKMLGWGGKAVNSPLGAATLNGTAGALHGYQNGGLAGAATEGGLGAVLGAKTGPMNAMTVPGISMGMNQVTGGGLPGIGGTAAGLMQRGQQFLGMGGPNFRGGIKPDVNTPNDLAAQFHQGMQEVNQAGQQWQDNAWSGGNYQKAIAEQRAKLYGDFRTRAQTLNIDPKSVQETTNGYTPQVSSADPQQMWQQMSQDPETLKAFQPHIQEMEQNLLKQVSAGKGVDLGTVKQTLLSRAASTAAAQGVAPDELLANAQKTLEQVSQNGITPETAQQIFQGPEGKELAQSLIDKGNVKGPQDLMQSLGSWMSENPMQAGMMMLGIPMALWSVGSMLGGNAGFGSLIGLLGGGALAAHGAGLFGGGVPGAPKTNLMDAMSQPGPPASIPVINNEPAGADTWASHYAQQVQTPEGAAQLHKQLMEDPETSKLWHVLPKPEHLTEFAQKYQQSPDQARQYFMGRKPIYAGQKDMDAGWQSIDKRLRQAYQTNEGTSGGGGDF